jgi:hypothetical protein
MAEKPNAAALSFRYNACKRQSLRRLTAMGKFFPIIITSTQVPTGSCELVRVGDGAPAGVDSVRPWPAAGGNWAGRVSFATPPCSSATPAPRPARWTRVVQEPTPAARAACVPKVIAPERGTTLNASLTVLLPVYNAQDHLVDQVERLLDLLPDLTRRFEIVIVDDGSTDDTADIAEQLSLFFPQVSYARHALRLGLNEAIQTGLNASTGEVVIVGDERYGILADDLQSLWQLHSRQDEPSGRRTDPGAMGVTWLSRVLSRSQQRQAAAARPLVQMVRRRNLNDVVPAVAAPADPSVPAVHRRLDAFIAADKAGPSRPSNRSYLDRMQKYTQGD